MMTCSFYLLEDDMTKAPNATELTLGRRNFFVLASGLAATSVLAGCGGGASSGSAAGTEFTGSIQELLPNLIPHDVAMPDIEGVDGSVPGFTSIPEEFVPSVAETPGRGSSFTAMTPLWSNVPPGKDSNEYMQEVDAAIGADFQFNITDGNTYNEKLQAVLASPQNIPDFVTVQSGGMPNRFEEALEANFEDLTPHLAGDAVAKYPNLAALPTEMWSCCVFGGRLYGLPYASDIIGNTVYYRSDIADELGVSMEFSDAAEFLEVLKEVTDPGANRWAVNDLANGAAVHTIFGTPPDWVKRDGALVHRYETEEYRAALDFQSQVFAAGVVHPDSVAGNSQQGRQRFISGQVLITGDGVGGWLSTLRQARPENPEFEMAPIPAFNGAGGDPVYWKSAPSNLFTFVKKSDDPSRIEEQLALADYFAAPFGSSEFALLEYGVEGVHHTRDEDGVFHLTEQGQREVVRTYTWISRSIRVATEAQFDGYVDGMTSWMASIMPFAEEPLGFGRTIMEPSEFASLSTPFDDLESDIARGRRPLSDLDAALENWRTSGGDRMRDHYAEIFDSLEDAE